MQQAHETWKERISAKLFFRDTSRGDVGGRAITSRKEMIVIQRKR